MVKVYNIVNDSENKPMLNLQDEFDINVENVSIEESVEILNNCFNMRNLAVEHAYLIGFDNQMNSTGILLVSIGSCEQCTFYRKSIAIFLLLSGTTRFILYHNHPGENSKASNADIAAITTIKFLANILEVEFIESVIITKNGWRCIKSDEYYEYDEEEF